jgi:hypothetical protein
MADLEIVDGAAGRVMSARSGALKLAPEWVAERSTVRIDDGAGLEFDVSAADGDVPALVVNLVVVRCTQRPAPGTSVVQVPTHPMTRPEVRGGVVVARTRYEQAADRGVTWLTARLGNNGSYGPEADDLACYYKSPYLLQLSGRARQAMQLLEFIQRRFMCTDHDFVTAPHRKSENAAFNEYWVYPNGWLAMGAQRLGRFDITYPTFEYLRSAHEPDRGGFLTSGPSRAGNGETDALTTAHLGLVCLNCGDRQRAEGAGRWLARLLTLQPDLRVGLFLRLDRLGHLIRDVPEDKAAFYLVSAHEPKQAYFMVGYPIAFLAKLYEATADEVYLKAARDYLDFALSCEGNLRSSPASHKVAWGAAVLARITSDPRCTELAITIADYLLAVQDPSGAWLIDQPAHTSFDQTAEISIWLQEISAELFALQ